MSNARYSYSVSIWDPNGGDDILLGDGSGPASHVIASLEWLIQEIRREEATQLQEPVKSDYATDPAIVGKQFFDDVVQGKRKASDWPEYILNKAGEELALKNPEMPKEEIREALSIMRRSPDFAHMIQLGLESGKALERLHDLKIQFDKGTTP